MNVTVCLPSRGPLTAGHATSREELFRARPSWQKCEVRDHPCLYIVRSVIAEDALSTGAEVLLWIDSDIVFSIDAAVSIVEEASARRAVVGAVYSKKKLGAPLVVGTKRNFHMGEPPLEVEWVGFGLTAVHRSVFEKIDCPPMTIDGHQARPWFTPKTDGSWDELLLDDASFCRRARESGCRIFADPRIRVGHEGVEKRVYYPEDSLR